VCHFPEYWSQESQESQELQESQESKSRLKSHTFHSRKMLVDKRGGGGHTALCTCSCQQQQQWSAVQKSCVVYHNNFDILLAAHAVVAGGGDETGYFKGVVLRGNAHIHSIAAIYQVHQFPPPCAHDWTEERHTGQVTF
jgi:hypothetical protein